MFDAKTLKTLLSGKRIKQAKLARMTDIPRNSICRYLSGAQQPSAARIKLIADALGVGIESLIIADEPTETVPTPIQKRRICFCPFCGEDLKGVD